MFWQKLTRNEAMRCFQRMVNEYGEETYFTGDDKSIVEFLAGGEGLSLEIEQPGSWMQNMSKQITGGKGG